MNKWRSFAAIASSFTTIVLATSMAFLVLSAIADEFDVTLRAVGWVVIVESLIISALLLPIGGLADAIGRRRILTTGLAIFGIGSLFAGMAPSFALLIAARVIMAVGNTFIQAIGTGLVVAAFPPEERGLALGGQTTAVSIGSAMGPLIGGLALQVLDWKTLFLLIAIPATLSFVAVILLVEPDEPRATNGGDASFDGVGGALSATAITALVLTINNPFAQPWTSPSIIGGAAVAVIVLALFIRWELNHPKPMLELRLFTVRVFRDAAILRLVGFVSSTTTLFLLPIYLLSYRDVASGSAGLILAILAFGTGTAAQLAGRLYDRVGPRLPSVIGAIMMLAGCVALAFLSATTSLVLIGVIVAALGIGTALWNVANNSALLGATPPEAFGVGGAFTNVNRTIGSVLGQAIAAALVAAVMSNQGFDVPLSELGESAGARQAFLDGWRFAFLVAAGFAATTLLVALRLPSGPPERRPVPTD